MAQWLDPNAPILARELQRAGYATGHFGKWHMGGQRDVDNAPVISDYGFDRSLTNFEGMGPKLLPLTETPQASEPKKIWADAERLGGPFTWMQRSRITGGFVSAALKFIDYCDVVHDVFSFWGQQMGGVDVMCAGFIGQTEAVAVGFVDQNKIRHFHNSAFYALQIVAGAIKDSLTKSPTFFAVCTFKVLKAA